MDEQTLLALCTEWERQAEGFDADIKPEDSDHLRGIWQGSADQARFCARQLRAYVTRGVSEQTKEVA